MTLNGKILSRDSVIGTVENGLLIDYDEHRLPLYLLRTKDVEGWLRGRAIDAHRTNSRLLKRALRIGMNDDLEAVLHVHAATVTDAYWFRLTGETLCYNDVRFKENQFAALALKGDPDSFNKPYSPTPELTNTGSYEKCWQMTNGKWQIVKAGNALERFSEVFISRLGSRLGFSVAEYEEKDGCVVSPDFTNGASVNYESAVGFVGDDEDYAVNFEAFWKLSPEIAKQYLQIIYLDTLCFNMDRHTQNYGVLRDAESGEVLSMAPNFDNNIALFSRGIPEDLSRKNDKLISLFVELIKQNKRALDFAAGFPTPNRKMLLECAAGVPVGESTVSAACDFIISGSEIIQEHVGQTSTMDSEGRNEKEYNPVRFDLQDTRGRVLLG